jgi:surfactin synthase thioesterase subunit
MRRVRHAGIPVTVIACSTDTLVTPAHCRRIAALCGGGLEELELDGGHMWMWGRWDMFADILRRT